MIDATVLACYTVRKEICYSFAIVAKVMQFMAIEDEDQQPPYISYPDLRKPRYRRQEAIRDIIQSNIDNKRPPCYNLCIRSLGELLWILMTCHWRGGLVESIGALGRDVSWFQRSRKRQDSATFQVADLQGLIARDLDVRWVDLEGALLQNANFQVADLSFANLCYAELSGTILTNTALTDTVIINQQRADDLSQLRQNLPSSHPYAGVEIRSRNELLWIMRREHWSGELEPGDNARADLCGAILTSIDFSGADFIGTDITNAVLLDDDEAQDFRKRAEENRENHQPPYKDVPIRERRELLWIMRENGWSGEPDPGQLDRADLRLADLRHAQLAKADLEGAILNRAKIEGVNLNRSRLCSAKLIRATGQFAQMQEADFTGAILDHSRLKSANFVGANLFGAHAAYMHLEQASLAQARLSVADIRGTDFRGGVFCGADLRGAKVDAATSFIDVTLDDRVRLGDIVWYGNPLTQIDWNNVTRIGDELEIAGSDGDDRAMAYRDAIRAYRGLWTALRRQGIYVPASRYRLREKRLERQFLREQQQWFDWFSSLRSDAVAGYGEEPWKALIMFCLVVVGYTALYYLVANVQSPLIPTADHSALNIIDCLKLSLTVFQGRTQQMGPVTFMLGVSETLLGAYILLAFTVLNTQKILGKPE